ncbi:MAG: C40 family peptidase [Lachnospiraceae bacterium]|nr:C40 family peptidase [Lachnospiraceae bacterium]
MRKSRWKWILPAAIFAVAGTGISIGAANIATEKAVAGITLSLDKYTDVMLAEQSSDNETEPIEKTVDKVSTKAEAAESDETEEDKEDTSHLKLNLVYDRLGVAKVDSYLNVRSKPSENAKIVGKMTRNSGCHIYTVKNGWAKMVSGKVKGWVKSEYLVKDEEAEALAKKVANLRITVTTETLNVRYLPSTDARVYDQISEESEYDLVKRTLTKDWVKTYMSRHCKKSEIKEVNTEDMFNNLDNWMCISIDNEKAFVSKDFVKVTYNLDRAVSIHENKSSSSKKGSGNDSASSTLSSIVAYAMQFLGNRYVYGGTSLTNGTDCSGFTMRIYEHFGYSIPRTSAAQAAALPSVSRSEVRPGDLFFYGSGGVSHVAMYIGNNQIIHASNERTGIKISYAYYRTPIKIGRVIR